RTARQLRGAVVRSGAGQRHQDAAGGVRRQLPPDAEDVVSLVWASLRRSRRRHSASARAPLYKTAVASVFKSMTADASPLEEARMDAASLVGTTLGPYQVHELIGRGAFSLVYRAEDVRSEEHTS